MLGKLSHVAIAVPDLTAAAATYKDTLGAVVSLPKAMLDHGVTSVFVELENTKLELLEPLGEDSPIAKFLSRNPGGGVHHLCFEVADLNSAKEKLEKNGVRILGTGEPQDGAHGKPILFLHPKDFFATLIELEQA